LTHHVPKVLLVQWWTESSLHVICLILTHEEWFLCSAKFEQFTSSFVQSYCLTKSDWLQSVFHLVEWCGRFSITVFTCKVSLHHFNISDSFLLFHHLDPWTCLFC